MAETIWGTRKGIGNPVTGSFIITIPKELVLSLKLTKKDTILFKTDGKNSNRIILEILKEGIAEA